MENNKIVEYDILMDHEYEMLVSKVNERLKSDAGWTILEGVKITDDGIWRKFWQTMVRIAQ